LSELRNRGQALLTELQKKKLIVLRRKCAFGKEKLRRSPRAGSYQISLEMVKKLLPERYRSMSRILED
jgi:hypothetical protein